MCKIYFQNNFSTRESARIREIDAIKASKFSLNQQKKIINSTKNKTNKIFHLNQMAGRVTIFFLWSYYLHSKAKQLSLEDCKKSKGCDQQLATPPLPGMIMITDSMFFLLMASLLNRPVQKHIFGVMVGHPKIHKCKLEVLKGFGRWPNYIFLMLWHISTYIKQNKNVHVPKMQHNTSMIL